MASTAMVMALLAVSLTQAIMDADSFERWGWRIPFLFAIILLAVSLVLRSKLRESPVFKNLAKKGKMAPAPLRQVLGDWTSVKSILVVAAGVCSPQITSGVTGSMLALYFLQTKTAADPAMSNLLIAAGCLTAIPMTVIAGALSDRFGRQKILVAGMAIGVLTYIPLFYALLTTYESQIASLLIIIGLQIPTSLIVGAAFSTVPEIFPAPQRMTSVAFAFSIGGIVGGLAPAVSLALTDKGGVLLGASWPVAVLLAGMIVNLLWVPNRTGASID
jgi:MFS family permease